MKDSVFCREKQLRVIPGINAHITEAIKEAIDISKSSGFEVTFNFNGIDVVVNKNSNFESVYEEYMAKTEQRKIEYLNSPEHKEYQARAQLMKQSSQNNLNSLMASIDRINFSDLEQAIPFLSQIIYNNDYIGVRYDRKLLIQKLRENGYYENMNCETEAYKIDRNDKEAVGKWLIGQYMSFEYPALSVYMDEWVKQFVLPEMEQDQTPKKM